MPCVEPFANLPLCLSRDINAIYCSGRDQFCWKWRQTRGQTGKLEGKQAKVATSY